MARRELEHFTIGGSYGGNQTWFRSFMMRLGGCGAETACDLSIYLELHKGAGGLCPLDVHALTRRGYVDFAHEMERYLWPRRTGIDKLSIFTEWYGKFLRDRSGAAAGTGAPGNSFGISLEAFDGSEPYERAAENVISRIDAGFPIPTLVLRHQDKAFKDYVWHWFLINGYEEREETVLVKTVTYSEYQWLDLKKLWDTGYENRGGLVLVSGSPEEGESDDH
ncbi:MAG: hypothetical protein II787_01785 [Lachnospiraceae bacterium]|nr:hypothetical protein [Lachnospiraceae bacterium]